MGDSITATLVTSSLAGVPLLLAAAPGDSANAFVVEQAGRVQVLNLDSGSLAATPFLDLSTEIATGGEMGLLGLAIHPAYAENRRFYVFLSQPDGDSEIRAYTTSAEDPLRADPASAATILTIDLPDDSIRHRGGWLGFGPDGYLYATTGDGTVSAAAADPTSLLGKVLRLDVGADAFPGDAGRNYAIPADNPFIDTGANEVWALGFRNPWRASFDTTTGRLFVGDVGEDDWEEVDIATAGGNYGWPSFEGPGHHQAAPDLPTSGFSFPIHAYGREAGDGTVIGGLVYRGPEAALQGQYVFGDFLSGRIWSLAEAADGTWRRSQLADPAGLDGLTGFGADGAGRLYALDADGEVYRLDAEPAPLDWNVLAARVMTNFLATGQWFV